MPCRILVMSLVLLCISCAGSVDEPPALETLVTLTYSEGNFAGRSGCNSYTGAVTAGEQPGDIVISPIISTRMACAEPYMQVESRYLTNLQAATKFGVRDGELTLTYQDEAGASRVMLFAPAGR